MACEKIAFFFLIFEGAGVFVPPTTLSLSRQLQLKYRRRLCTWDRLEEHYDSLNQRLFWYFG